MNNRQGEAVSVILVGIGGMGFHYLKTLLGDFPGGKVNVRAAVDPFPERSALFGELKKRKIPVYPALQDTIGAGHKADLVIVSSPLQYHVGQCLEALRAGSFVLCEKPLAATIQEADRLIKAPERKARWIRMGYQWSYTAAIQELKRDVKSGRFGKPVRIKSLYLWPRDTAYYKRNEWAGCLKDKDGSWVLDSPANGAMAHDLHNLFYLLGEEVARSAQPVEVTAELYRAYPIENYDTVACRAKIQGGVELLFYASHVTHEIQGPMFSLEFEEAVVSYGEEERKIIAVMSSSRKKSYGSPEDENPFNKLFEATEAVRNPIPVVCGPEASRSQTLCVSGMQDSVDEIVTFSRSQLQQKEGRLWVKGLAEAFTQCYQKGILPSEAGFTWARQGKKVDLLEYCYFPGGRPPGEGREQGL